MMSILTGLNGSQSGKNFDPNEAQFIWKKFQKNGFATAHGEDTADFPTFNTVNKSGFYQPPTTHYFRPFSMAIERFLDFQWMHFQKFYIGFQTYADFLFKYAIDFSEMYKNDKFFGFFWCSTFSHDEFSFPSTMDLKIKGHLHDLKTRGVLDTSAVIFLSDHGIRYGRIHRLMVSDENYYFHYEDMPITSSPPSHPTVFTRTLTADFYSNYN
jgi:hypothetical protein